ncbi:MAG TPA: VOC family protein, partial [Quisquiliibacterium sp.]|nr:VOC family protein [Quisquiliibacterium sp.]
MSPWERYGIELDHLVVGTPDLDEGARWLQARLGVVLQPGGRHAGWGT